MMEFSSSNDEFLFLKFFMIPLSGDFYASIWLDFLFYFTYRNPSNSLITSSSFTVIIIISCLIWIVEIQF